eukprot:Blabericola_migrator_1__5509@NODE_280_length_10436_cov_136_209085_g230_i0_p1_GENE_NODE_280_length_10436_cov_136_209085_g230_i0NODE_280_length_10436_cov_136_209085_g230_i0_p1_ORF_typecomplete_len1060_score268_05_NODE_280_length_10436_cov_136_209085_g230_i046497828
MPLTPPRLGLPGSKSPSPVNRTNGVPEIPSVHTSTTPQRKPHAQRLSKVAAKQRIAVAAKSRPERPTQVKHTQLKHKTVPLPPPLKDQQPRKSNIRALRKGVEEVCRPSVGSESSGMLTRPIRETLISLGMDPECSASLTFEEEDMEPLPGTRRTPVPFPFGGNTSSCKLSVQRLCGLDGNLKDTLQMATQDQHTRTQCVKEVRRARPHKARRLHYYRQQPVEFFVRRHRPQPLEERQLPPLPPLPDKAVSTTESGPSRNVTTSNVSIVSEEGLFSFRDPEEHNENVTQSFTHPPTHPSTQPTTTQDALKMLDVFKARGPPPDVSPTHRATAVLDVQPRHESMLRLMDSESLEFVEFCLRLKRLMCPNALLTDFLTHIDRHKAWSLLKLARIMPDLRVPSLVSHTCVGIQTAEETDKIEAAIQTLDDEIEYHIKTSPVRWTGVEGVCDLERDVTHPPQSVTHLPQSVTHPTQSVAHPSEGVSQSDTPCVTHPLHPHSPHPVSPIRPASPIVIHQPSPTRSPQIAYSTMAQASAETAQSPGLETPTALQRVSVATPMTSMSSILYSRPRGNSLVSSDIMDSSDQTQSTQPQVTVSPHPCADSESPGTCARHAEHLNSCVQPGTLSFVTSLFLQLQLDSHRRDVTKTRHTLRSISNVFEFYKVLVQLIDDLGEQIREAGKEYVKEKQCKMLLRGDAVLRRRMMITTGKFLKEECLPNVLARNSHTFKSRFYTQCVKLCGSDQVMPWPKATDFKAFRQKVVQVPTVFGKGLTEGSVGDLLHRHVMLQIRHQERSVMEACDPSEVQKRLLPLVQKHLSSLDLKPPAALKQIDHKPDLNELSLTAALARYRASNVSTCYQKAEEEDQSELMSRLLRLDNIAQNSILGLTGRFELSSLFGTSQRNHLYGNQTSVPWLRFKKVGDGANLMRPFKSVPIDAALSTCTDGVHSPGSVSSCCSRPSPLSIGLSPKVHWTPPPRSQENSARTSEVGISSVGGLSASSLLKDLSLADFLNMPVTPNHTEAQNDFPLMIVSSIDRSQLSRGVSSLCDSNSSGVSRETPVPKK